ncbi:MAG: hypothetical protein AB7O97_12500 [Planctomycetota bacterium]
MHSVPAVVALPLSIWLSAACVAQTVVFADDFNGVVPAAVQPGAAAIEGVQGFAGLGPAGNTFGSTFLRSPTGNAVTVQLSGLPPHNAISIDFLFAAIDSLDGTGAFPSGDFFHVTLDGNTIFRESFANARADQIQSYVPPAGVQLARRVDLGFSGPGSFYTDSAYWLGGDPVFQRIGHTASTATFTLQVEGPGIQGLSDESWAMDNLQVIVENAANPGSAVAYGTSCGPTLIATSTPRVGHPLDLLLLDLPPNAGLVNCMLGLSDAVYAGNPLPLDLAIAGLPGCFLLQDLLFGAFAVPLVGTAAQATVAIPGDPALAGLTVFVQAWAAGSVAGQPVLEFSNGQRCRIGQ